MVHCIDQSEAVEPLREVLVALLVELNRLSGRRTGASHDGAFRLTEGPAAFRVQQWNGLTTWLERQLEENPLHGEEIRRHQQEILSALRTAGQEGLVEAFNRIIGGTPDSGGSPPSVIHGTVTQRARAVAAVLNAPPQMLHMTLLQSPDESSALRTWEKLQEHEGYLSPDILVQIILNTGFREVILQAWNMLKGMVALERKHLNSLSTHAPLDAVRTEAQALIGM
ncbi:MAG: hypothetical protein WCS85_04775 [Candidatus Peribacteraceae bacterium]|jgi:hypothetical protein